MLLVGFGDGFVSNERNFELLAQVFMAGDGDNVLDMYHLNRPKKMVGRLYLGAKDKDTPVVFALFSTHGVPRYLANELVQTVRNSSEPTLVIRNFNSTKNNISGWFSLLGQVSTYIDVCSRLLIFHSDTLAYYLNDETCDGKVFYVASSKYSKAELPSSCHPLTPPNVIGGVSAAVLTHGEMNDKPALLLATYAETELIDSISLKPFANAIKQLDKNKKATELSTIFSQLELSISQCVKSNVNAVATSNLYI